MFCFYLLVTGCDCIAQNKNIMGVNAFIEAAIQDYLNPDRKHMVVKAMAIFL
jgi:hypothetical protein